jgi:uncharacterized protein YjbJ (UPF0337 family)
LHHFLSAFLQDFHPPGAWPGACFIPYTNALMRKEPNMEFKTLIRSNWNEIKGKVRQKWANLTDNDVELLQGNVEEFTGKIQKLYGLSKDEVRRHLDDLVVGYRDKGQNLMNKAKDRVDQVNRNL